jgi:hypothetical protein
MYEEMEPYYWNQLWNWQNEMTTAKGSMFRGGAWSHNKFTNSCLSEAAKLYLTYRWVKSGKGSVDVVSGYRFIWEDWFTDMSRGTHRDLSDLDPRGYFKKLRKGAL